MENLPQINLNDPLTLIFLISFGAFILSLGYTLYYWIHKRHHKQTNAGNMDPRDAAVHEAVKIVDQARHKAMSLLNEAHLEAKGILDDSDHINTDTKQLFEQKMQDMATKQMEGFDQVAHELLESYKAILSQEKDSSLKSLMDVSGGLKQQINDEVQSFASGLKKATSDTESAIRSDFDQQKEQVTQEMNNLTDKLKGLTADAESKMQESLGGQYGLIENEIKGLSEGLKAATAEAANKIKEDVAKESEAAKEVVHNFAGDLKRVAEETENTLKEGVKGEFDKVREEIAAYKEERVKKIDDSAKGVLEEVARDVLGKTMNAQDHEELILKSLDSIKRSTNLKEL